MAIWKQEIVDVFELNQKDRITIVNLLRNYYSEVTQGKSIKYLDEEQKKEAHIISNMVSLLGYNAFTEGMSF